VLDAIADGDIANGPLRDAMFFTAPPEHGYPLCWRSNGRRAVSFVVHRGTGILDADRATMAPLAPATKPLENFNLG
jgi:hypothetical protein